MSNYKKIKPQLIRRTQRDILREFFIDEYVEFEMSGSPLVGDALPTKQVYKNIISNFKKGINQKEVARFCVEVDELYKKYLQYCANYLYQINIFNKRQFTIYLHKLTLLDDMREIIVFRYSRKQIKYAFPLLKREKL